jgi:hypothetical protein
MPTDLHHRDGGVDLGWQRNLNLVLVALNPADKTRNKATYEWWMG